MPYTTLGVIGHVDHGKTALVKALTGTDTDRLREERERGISIALGYAHLELPSGEMGIIDAPGHEKFIRTMVSGATGMHAVLLVVDVNEGVKPQTIEHLDIALLLGVERGVIAITKCDTADDALKDIVLDDVQSLVLGTPLEHAAVVSTSAVTGEGLDELRGALDAVLQACEMPPDEGTPYLPVDRAFTMTGFGTVVTGTLRGGAISVGDEVELYPKGIRAGVRELQSHGQPTERALPGYRTAVNLRGVDKERVGRGDVIAAPGSLTVASIVDVRARLLDTAEAPLKNRQMVRLLFGTTETFARTHLLDRDELLPGDECGMQLRVEENVASLNYEPFILRTYSPMTTIGGGLFLGTARAGYRRGDSEALRRLQALATGSIDERIAETALAAGAGGITLDALARRVRARREDVADRMAHLPLVAVDGDRVLHEDVHSRINGDLEAAVRAFHEANPTLKGMPRDQLNADSRLRLDDGLFGALVDALVQDGALTVEQGLVRTAGFTPEGALSEKQRAIAREIEHAFKAEGLTPPRVDEVAMGDRERTRIHRFLVEQGALIPARVSTRSRTQDAAIAFHRDHIDDAAERLRTRFGDEAFTASAAKETLGISRKYLIPLLESMDALGLTKRDGDRRTVSGGDAAAPKASQC